MTPFDKNPKDPLHGVTLEQVLGALVDRHGWAKMGHFIPVRCFKWNPGMKSSLTFLRKTPWARKKVEDWYLSDVRRESRGKAPAPARSGGKMKITVRKPTEDEAKAAASWPVWEKEVSSFPWSYAEKEACLILEGEVTVAVEGAKVSFKAGDYVIFPEGLSCTWTVRKPVKKHYKFG